MGYKSKKNTTKQLLGLVILFLGIPLTVAATLIGYKFFSNASYIRETTLPPMLKQALPQGSTSFPSCANSTYSGNLVWQNVQTGSQYRVEVSTNSSFSNSWFIDSPTIVENTIFLNIPSDFRQLGKNPLTLSPNNTYYSRISLLSVDLKTKGSFTPTALTTFSWQEKLCPTPSPIIFTTPSPRASQTPYPTPSPVPSPVIIQY